MGLAACASGGSVATTASTTIEVVSVADGDTIDVKGISDDITVRLAAINAPDRGECLAEDARAHLIESLEGADVTLETIGSDQFGRTLAHVFEGDRHVNLEMVALGLAIASTPDSADRHGADLIAAEEDAVRSSRGMWSPDACGAAGTPPDVRIEGRESVFDPPGPDDEHLDDEYIVITNHQGSLVDVSGWVLRDESTRHRYVFAPESIVGPGESVRVETSAGGWSPGGGPVWSNGGDMALLLDPIGTVVSRWRY